LHTAGKHGGPYGYCKVSISEIANVIHDERAPYVGKYAFAHKAGMHADAVTKNSIAYEHINPEVVGTKGFFSCRKLREEALCFI